jgi:glycosyltransferase involved in cell wall biosynthesis
LEPTALAAERKTVVLSQSEARQAPLARMWRRVRHPTRNAEQHLARQLEVDKVDVLHYPGTTVAPLTVNLPCVVTFFDLQHEYHPEFFTPAELALRAQTYRPSVEKAVRVIAPSHYTDRSLVEKSAAPADKLAVIPVGIPNDLRPPTRQEILRVREEYGLPDCYLYYPANPWPHKNHARLMAALRCYGEPPLMVLSGRLRGEVRDAMQLAVAAGVERHVKDLGFVPALDLPALYGGARAMIFPSLFEGFGMPLLEAMAYGCPVAAANATAIPECVGEAGVLFDPLDPAAIAEAINKVVNDESLRRRLVQLGLDRLSSYQWRNLVPKIFEVYRQAADQGGDEQRD